MLISCGSLHILSGVECKEIKNSSMKIRCSCFNMEIERIVQPPPLLLQNIIKLHFIVPSAIHPSVLLHLPFARWQRSSHHHNLGELLAQVSTLLVRPSHESSINSFMNHGVQCVLYALLLLRLHPPLVNAISQL